MNNLNKEKNRMPIIWIVIVVVLAIVGSVGGTYLTNKFLAHPSDNKAQAAETTRVSKDEVLVAMDEFLVNLAKNGKDDPQYIRIKLSLLTEDKSSSEELTQNIAVVRDSVVNLLRQKKADEILSTADSVANLKKQILDAVNKEYGSPIVKEVFVTDLVVQ